MEEIKFMGIVAVASIVVLCYIVGAAVKAIQTIDNKWIPVICGVFGIGLGLLAYFLALPSVSNTDPILAAAQGGFSGLAATGVNQIIKQFTPNDTGKGEEDE